MEFNEDSLVAMSNHNVVGQDRVSVQGSGLFVGRHHALDGLLAYGKFYDGATRHIDFQFGRARVVFRRLGIYVILVNVSSIMERKLEVRAIALRIIYGARHVVAVSGVGSFFFRCFIFGGDDRLGRCAGVSRRVNELVDERQLIGRPWSCVGRRVVGGVPTCVMTSLYQGLL